MENEAKRRYVPDKKTTAQDILVMPESRYQVSGARMFAAQLLDCINNRSELKNVKTIVHFLEFFKTCNRDDLLQYICGMYDGIKLEKCGKGKNEYIPIKVVPFKSSELINPYEFVSGEEQRFRKLCEILLTMLENMSVSIGVMTGQASDEVLNQLVNEVNEKVKGHNWELSILDETVE